MIAVRLGLLPSQVAAEDWRDLVTINGLLVEQDEADKEASRA